MPETSPVPAASPAFMQTWGHLVWMSVAISLVGIALWITTGLPDAMLIVFMLTCLEVTMFLENAESQRTDPKHPLTKWFAYNADADLTVVAMAILTIVAWIVLFIVHISHHDWFCIIGITVLPISQALLSKIHHRSQHHGDAPYNEGSAMRWIQPLLYAVAIIGEICGVWLIR